jgi:hypothetical protein
MKEQSKVNVPAHGIVSLVVGGKTVELHCEQQTTMAIHAAQPVKNLRVMQELPLGRATAVEPGALKFANELAPPEQRKRGAS